MAEIFESLAGYSLSRESESKGSIQKIGVIGGGNMGQEIIIHIARNGLDVVFLDLTLENVNATLAQIETRLLEIVDRWGMTPSEKKGIQNKIKGTVSYQDIKDCDIVIEAINSRKKGTNIEIRKEVFRQIEEVVSPDTIIASNTATLMISDLSSVLRIPQRALGLHFIAPVSTNSIVEVVKSYQTNEESFATVNKFIRMIGKKAIIVNESPGVISTRLMVTLINEACHILMEGVSSVRDIDETMKQALGHQFGPFELADRIGLDKLLKWMDNLYAEFGELKFKPSPILKRLVRMNHLGKAHGIGFYAYENGVATAQTVVCSEIK
jgi:3-hydroxybutyryl-CoA dehydrogenase